MPSPCWRPNPLVFFLLLMPVGLVIGCIEMIINLEADRTEHLVGFRIMNRAHAFWSIGFFAAGLFGAWMAQLGISPQVHLADRHPDRRRRRGAAARPLRARAASQPAAAPTRRRALPRPTGAIMVLVARDALAPC